MIVTIIVLYSFIVRCLTRQKELLVLEEAEESTTALTASNTTTQTPATSSSSISTASSTTTSIALNNYNINIVNHSTNTLSHLNDKALGLDALDINKGNLSDSSKEDRPSDNDPFLDEVADDNQFDEEEFYNIIATKAAAFQSKRNSSTSLSSGSIYDADYRTKRNSLRSQSSTASDVMETATNSIITNRRSSEESCRLSNRKINYKTRRHGFQTLSKRRRTTGRY